MEKILLKIDLLEHFLLVFAVQQTIIENFVKEESTIRLTICTVVFGLGVNIPDVRFVVHQGECDSALQYWQEVGRAGRNGNKAKAYMDTVSDWGSSDQGLCTFQLHFNNNNAKHDGKYHSKDVNMQMLKLGIQRRYFTST